MEIKIVPPTQIYLNNLNLPEEKSLYKKEYIKKENHHLSAYNLDKAQKKV